MLRNKSKNSHSKAKGTSYNVGQPEKPRATPDIIARLNEIRSVNRPLNREELEYIVSTWDNYHQGNIKKHTSWKAKNIESMRSRLYGSYGSVATNTDGYSLVQEFLQETSVKDYFNKLNKKSGLFSPDHASWFIQKLDYICNKYMVFEEYKLADYRIAFSMPPRSSKSLLICSFIFKILLEQPHLRIVYISNNQQNLKTCNSIVRGYLRDVGTIFSPDINNSNAFVIDKIPGHFLENISCGGGCSFWTPLSIAQGISGDVLIVDDIFANRQEAESLVMREKIIESFKANAMTRLTRYGCVLVVSTRYHKDDLIGVITNPENGWNFDYKNIPAITLDEEGNEQSYWPKCWSVKKLNEKRKQIGEYNWQSLYQGNPIVRAESLFGLCNRYEELPPGNKYVWAVDMAYSEKSKADSTCLVKMSFNKETKQFYIERAQKWKSNIDRTLKRIKEFVGNNTVHWAIGGTESSIVKLAKENYGLNIKSYNTKQDKYNRALKMSANFDNVLFANTIDHSIIEEVESFNGDGRNHDDATDAIVTAYNVLTGNSGNIQSFEEASQNIHSSLGNFRFNSLLKNTEDYLDDDDD